MGELFATFDARGQQIGIATRERVHRQGFWHRAANVFLFRSDGRLLLQQRRMDKDVCPGAWDLSVAEHVHLAESFATAAARGLREELAVDGVVLQPLAAPQSACVDRPALGIRDHEIRQSFRAVFDGDITPCPDEVAAIDCVTLEQLMQGMARDPDAYTPWLREHVQELKDQP